MLAGCQGGSPFGPAQPGGEAAAAGAAPEAIEVTALDAPAASADGAATPDAAPSAPADVAEGAAVPAADAAAEAAPADTAATDAAAPGAAALAEPPPEAVKTPGQIACEKSRGRYVRVGNSTAYTCVHTTRDGGKTCRKASDCEGLCLARSRTCSPFTPVLGCQEILQQDGLRVTQCVE